MKFKKKSIVIIVIVVVLVVMFGWAGINFGAGSYPFVERYEIESDQESIIAAVDTFFDVNEKYCLPNDSYLIDSQCKVDGYWYHIYFYLPDENRYLYTWIRESKDHKRKTTFALVAISENLEPGNWSRVNNDLSRKENRRVKKIFEEEILEPIKDILKEEE